MRLRARFAIHQTTYRLLTVMQAIKGVVHDLEMELRALEASAARAHGMSEKACEI
jgi:hypothetical protein